MSKKQDFINFVQKVFDEYDIGPDHMPENVSVYWQAFCSSEENEKPLFTDNGKLILCYMKANPSTAMWKSKDIAEGLFINSRAVSGAMRKLITDGFVEKVGQNPTIYSLTENGKNIEIE